MPLKNWYFLDDSMRQIIRTSMTYRNHLIGVPIHSSKIIKSGNSIPHPETWNHWENRQTNIDME